MHRSAVIGLRIGDPCNRGQGFGADALRLVVNYCWNHLNLTRIVLIVFATNERALRLYLAHGFEVEGVMRQAVFIAGEWVDVILMGLLHPSRITAACTIETHRNDTKAIWLARVGEAAIST